MTLTAARDVSALVLFDAALARAAAGIPVTLTLQGESLTEQAVQPDAWCRSELPGDQRLLESCAGATLDIGCGPGRLTTALNQLGKPALGIDVSPTAVRLARARGATVLHRDVFDPLPGTGRWPHLLLADGNIGIGGNPSRLLRRCRQLLAPYGRLHLELAPPGARSWAGRARLRVDQVTSRPFPWAVLAADALPALTTATDLQILTTWTEADRWFATLIPN